MSDNLTVTIGADSSKLRAELALVNQATKAAQKELNTLAAAFNKTGASADRLKLDAQAVKVDQYKRQIADLNRQLATLSPTFNRVGHSAEGAASALQEFVHQGRGLGRVVNEFSNLSRSAESFGGIFGRLTGGFAGGLAGFAIGKAFGVLRDQIDAVSKSLTELRNQAGQIGVKPIVLQSAQDLAKGLGEDADVATKMLQGLSKQFDEVRKESAQRPEDKATVLRGGGSAATGGIIQLGSAVSQTTTILRGGAQAVVDFTKPLAVLGLELRNTPLAKLGSLDNIRDALTKFVVFSKEHANDLRGLKLETENLFPGVAPETALRVALRYLEQIDAQIKKNKEDARGATDPEIAANLKLIASQNEVAHSYENLTSAISKAVRPARIAFNEEISAMLDEARTNFNTNVAALEERWRKFGFGMSSVWSDAWKAMGDVVTAGLENFRSAWQSTLDWLSNAVSTAFAAVKSAASSVASSIANVTSSGGGNIALPFASGGMVRGAGSGTSDSIMARLSNGEFVMRADAVRHWGSDLMASLNGLRNPGFALGGLVSTLPRFAEGGPAAGGATPVHLHLGGNSFALSGNESVVSSLVVEAHRQQMRSAGTKPSWYAARPGG